MKVEVKVAQTCLTLWNPMVSSPRNSPGQNTGVDSLSFFSWGWIFPTQGSNSGLSHCRQILYQLSHKGSWRTLEWLDYPFTRGSSRPRNWTGVSYTAGRFFTNWAIREAHIKSSVQFSSVQSLSHVWLFVIMDGSTPGLPVHHQLPEFTQTHVQRVSDIIQPSHPLSLSPPAPNQSLFQWVNSSHEVANLLEFQL